jgi:V8-like Glu-specific endopeptidase
MRTHNHSSWLIALAVCLTMVLPVEGSPVWAAGTTAAPSQTWVVRGLPGQSIIFGQDNRTRVTDTTQFPWSAIGQVVCDYGFELAIGTGAMIGNKTVLTAAHVIYDQQLGWPISITFIPGLNGSLTPFGEINAVQHTVPDQWKQGNQDYDLGLITLESEVGQQTGFLQLVVEPDSFYTNQALESAGYPADKGDGNEMYSVTGQSTGVEGKVMLHRITTEEGQSGSPIWFTQNGVPAVVGLNVGWEEVTGPSGTVDNGLGTRIDEEFGTLVNNTLAQYGDQTQPNLPGATVTPVPTPSPSRGICGIGAGQALAVISLCWGACFVSRRGRRVRV